MISRYLFVLVVLLPGPALSAQGLRPLGINLASVHDYGTEFAFADAVRQARGWIPHHADGSGPWDSGVDVPLGTRGYPVEIPWDNGVDPPQRVRTLMLWDLGSWVPEGWYRLSATGQGRIRLAEGASGTFEVPVDTLVYVDGGVILEIERSDSADPVRDIRFLRPGYTDREDPPLFTEAFLSFVADFGLVRYMDWQRTNGSPLVQWNDRTRADAWTQTGSGGVALEHIVALANATGTDAWVCVPHMADDEYVVGMAALLRDGLDTARRLYIEYSNEVWNAQFAQHEYAADRGADLGFPGSTWERAWRYTAKRSADVFYLFDSVWGGSERLVRVLPSQAANAWLSGQLIGFLGDPVINPRGMSADVLAVAPYFGGGVADAIVDEGLAGSVTVPEILDRLDASLPEAFSRMEEQQAAAEAAGLGLVMYEGGPHLVATGANVHLDGLTVQLNEANRHARMYDLVCRWLEHWYASAGGGLLAYFSSHGKYTKWGSWGVREHMDDSLSPKYRALRNCGMGDSLPPPPLPSGFSGPSVPEWTLYPNPVPDGRFIVRWTGDEPEWRLVDAFGRPAAMERVDGGAGWSRWYTPVRGTCLLEGRRAGARMARRLVLMP